MKEPSIFTKIINHEIPAHRVYEDERVIAFLTNHPLCNGHTLVVPKKQIDQIWDLELDDYHFLWDTSQKIALHIKKVLNAERVGIVVKGFEVPHAHIHLIPVMPNTHVNFDPEPTPPIASDEQLKSISEQLRF